jgi:hypothetical protein
MIFPLLSATVCAHLLPYKRIDTDGVVHSYPVNDGGAANRGEWLVDLKAANSIVSEEDEMRVKTTVDCAWWMLSGDSNMRKIATELQNVLRGPRWNGPEFLHETRVDDYPGSRREFKIINGIKRSFDLRWSTEEIVITKGDECVILTRRFMQSQQPVEDVHSTEYLGTHLKDIAIAPKFHRPDVPSLFWYEHGLWSLPVKEHKKMLEDVRDHRQSSFTCASRFHDHVEFLKKMQHTSNVVWQTNFPIHKHPTITNEYLTWEVGCQRKVAEESSIQLFDLAAEICEGPESQVSDFHLYKKMSTFVARNILVEGCNSLTGTNLKKPWFCSEHTHRFPNPYKQCRKHLRH